MTVRPGSDTKVAVWAYEDGEVAQRSDRLVTEEPLEIRIQRESNATPLAVTMRTPGADFELAAGFLVTEGAVKSRLDLIQMAYCVDREADEQLYNVVTVRVRGDISGITSLHRHFYTSSACGVCGKANLEALKTVARPVASSLQVTGAVLYGLGDALRAAQGVFDKTGGLHAAGLFDGDGNLLAVREDVGRHNAVDKLVGWAFLNDRLPLSDDVLMVSGRASFEIMQKAAVAGIPIVCAVSAPSSLAVQVAEDFGMTLVGFLRNKRFNVYAGRERIVGEAVSVEGAAGLST